MRGLTIVKNSVNKPRPVSPQAVEDAVEVADTLEAMAYLVDRFGEVRETWDKPMQEASLGLYEKLKARLELLTLAREANGNPWSAISPDTEFMNLQRNIANNASDKIKQEVTAPVRIDLAINNLAQFIRGFSAKGQSLSAMSDNHMDQLLNAFLSSNNIMSKNSTLYESTEKGVIEQEGGQPKKADPKQVEQLLTDKEHGLTEFLEEQGIKVDSVRTHNYPTAPAVATREVTEVAPAPTAARE